MGAILGPSKVSSIPEGTEKCESQVHSDHSNNHDDGGKYRTFDDLVVGEVQVEQEQHVQQRQSPTEQQARSLTHSAGQQNRHLIGDQIP